jgi:hypothetical protein
LTVPEIIDTGITSGTQYVCANSSGVFFGCSGGGGGSVFPVTVSGTVNSGGIPCFNSATNEESSATIAAGHFVVGGGSGACVTSVAGISISSLIAATGTNSVPLGNYRQTWTTALTSASSIGLFIDEASAATGGSPGSQELFAIVGSAGSTATPAMFENSLTGSQTLPALYVQSLWNTSGTVAGSLLVNATITGTPGTGSLLAAFQNGGTNEETFDYLGNITALGSISLGASPPTGCSASGCIAFNETGCSGTPTTSVDYICSSSGHVLKSSLNGGSELAIPQVIASGTAAMGTSAISSGACASAVTTSATGVATTDTIIYVPNADPTGVTGYAVASTGSLYIWAYPTSGDVNFKVCNNTAGSLTPSALTLNWKVVR